MLEKSDFDLDGANTIDQYRKNLVYVLLYVILFIRLNTNIGKKCSLILYVCLCFF